MEQTETTAPLTGSIADVVARLALWGRRAPKGLARVEFVSDFSRQEVVSELRAALLQHIPFHEIELPFQEPAVKVVRFLRERLRELPPGVVSITGFATAFPASFPLQDALDVLNFSRERLADFPLCQIWWMPPFFTHLFLHAVPDLNSWFMIRLKLSEVPERKIARVEPTKDVAKGVLNQALRQSNHLAARAIESLQRDPVIVEEYLEQANWSVNLLTTLGAKEEASSLASKLCSEVTRGPWMPDLDLEDESSLKGFSSCRRILVNLARLYDIQQEYPKAEALYKRALELKETTQQTANIWHLIGTDDTFVLSSLAWSCANQNRYIDAELFYQEAYSLAVTNFQANKDYLQYVSFLQGLYNFYRYTNQLEKAEMYSNMALTISEGHKELLSTNVAARANDLATIYSELGRFKEAEVLLEKALHFHMISSAPIDARLSTLLLNLGLIYTKQRKPHEAEPLFSEALKIREAKFGVDNIKVAEVLKPYSDLLHSLSRDDEARQMEDRVAMIESEYLSENSVEA